jgi:glycosyltransferase involved in cell wall biosynthesis
MPRQGGTAARPRLLVLASTYPRWDGDHEPGFVHELCKRLVREFDVLVLTPHAKGAKRREVLDHVRIERYRYAPAVAETLVNDGGIVTNLRRHPWKWLLVPSFMFMMLWSAWRAMRAWRPQVVHAHWLIPQGVVAALLDLVMRDSPGIVVTSHGADLFALRAGPLRQLKRWVVRRAKVVTVVSHAMASEARELGLAGDKLRVEPMGVDMESRFRPDAGTPRSNRELLFVGRLVEKKGLGHLLDAMPAILKALPDTRLSVIGFGPLESEYRRQVERLDIGYAVDFLGAVPQADLPAHYRRASVFVAPFVQAVSGDREGLGLVLVEAAGCGCPIIVSDVPAARDVVGTSDAAAVVPSGDPEALAAACIDVLGRQAESRKRAEEIRDALRGRFDWSARAEAYMSLLRQAVP